MKFTEPAGNNPIDQLKVVGQPHPRIEGPLKTTGTAVYSYENHAVAPNAAYGYIVGAGSGCDTKAFSKTIDPENADAFSPAVPFWRRRQLHYVGYRHPPSQKQSVRFPPTFCHS